jgi:hypothetical protein
MKRFLASLLLIVALPLGAQTLFDLGPGVTAPVSGGGITTPVPTADGGTGADLSAAPTGAIPFSDGATPAVLGTSGDLAWDDTAKAIVLGSTFRLRNLLGAGFTLETVAGGDAPLYLRDSAGITWLDALDGTQGYLYGYTVGDPITHSIVNVQDAWAFLSTGLLQPLADNSNDLGEPLFQVRTGYFGTSVVSPTFAGAEGAEPAAPADGSGVVWWKDAGGGKTALMVRFPSGASQQIAIEP